MGKLYFKQYTKKNKKDKFGIKELKLCISPCYTIAIKIYAGKKAKNVQNVGSIEITVVMELVELYLDCGRTLYVDNWYLAFSWQNFYNRRR